MKENNNKKNHLKNNGSFALAKDGCSKHVRARELSGCKIQWAELKEELRITKKKKNSSVPWPAFNSCESENFSL